MQLLSLSPFVPLLPRPRFPISIEKLHKQNTTFSLLSSSTATKCYASDEFPIDETFLEQFGPKDMETEEEARKKNWVERGWAPWEEILTPEARFARLSLNEGEEVELKDPETIEAFKRLRPSYREQKRKEMGWTEEEEYERQFDIKGEILEPLKTVWDGPLVVRHVAPRDWPPRGWVVDRSELEFIRESHKMMSKRVEMKEIESAERETDGMALERYKAFLKQYKDWVEKNKDKMEEEAYKVGLGLD